jgi:hypothetical protein
MLAFSAIVVLLSAALVSEAVASRRRRRRQLHEKITRFAQHSDDVLGRWAAVTEHADLRDDGHQPITAFEDTDRRECARSAGIDRLP